MVECGIIYKDSGAIVANNPALAKSSPRRPEPYKKGNERYGISI